MKTLRLLAVAAMLIGLTACGNQAETFSGRIKRTDGKSVTIIAENGRIITFTTENADMKEAHGLLKGNKATVEYEGELTTPMPALKISTDPTYARAIGCWMKSNPENPSSAQGLRIKVKGVVRPINMPGRYYKSWDLGPEKNQIILQGVLQADERLVPFEQTATIVEEDGKPALSLDGTLWFKQDRD